MNGRAYARVAMEYKDNLRHPLGYAISVKYMR